MQAIESGRQGIVGQPFGWIGVVLDRVRPNPKTQRSVVSRRNRIQGPTQTTRGQIDPRVGRTQFYPLPVNGLQRGSR